MDPYKTWAMDVLKKELVDLCMDHPPGTPVQRLHMLYQHAYGKPLAIKKSNLETFLRSSPVLRFCSSGGELCVWHSTGRDLSPASSTSSISSTPECSGPSAKKICSAKTRIMESPKMVLENLVSLLKLHPGGLPLKKLAEFYNKMYHHNLSASALGFNSIVSLVDSLSGQLVVEGGLVFHVTHRPQGRAGAEVRATTSTAPASGTNCPATPKKSKAKPRSPAPPAASLPQSATDLHYGPPPSTTISFGGPLGSVPVASSTTCSAPLVSLPSTSNSSGNLTEEQLLQRIVEVIKKYSYASASLEQLQNCYFLQFGEKLPLQQYMSVYKNWEASMTQTTTPAPKEITDQASGPNVNQVITPLQQPGATPTTLVKEDHQPAPSKPAAVKPASTLINKQSTRPPLIATPPVLEAPVSVSVVSDSDFPALSELDKQKMSKTQQKRLLMEEEYRKASAVSKDAYHAQQREVHGANMRAADVLMAEEDDPRSRRQRRVLDPEQVNSLIQDVIRDIATEGELVTKDKVISRVCTLMQVPSLEVGRIKPWQLPALRDLQYLIREIHMFIEATESATAMCTLYELGQSLAALKDKKRYEELNMGPLCKLPLIHRIFKIDSNTKDDDIQQIETVDILRNLRLFRTSASQKNKSKIDLADFMKYLADHYNRDSPYELGIRITSLGLPIASLTKATRSEYLLLHQAQEAIGRELEGEAQERMRKIKKSVMEPAQGPVMFSSIGSLELRKKYVSMTAAEAVFAVFKNGLEVFSSRMNKRFTDFMLVVSSDRLATALFQLAICSGSLATPQDLVAKDKPSKKTEQNNTEDKSTAAPPSEAAVKQFLKDSLSSHSSAVTLAHISLLEKKLIKHFQVKEFLSLEKGTFLEFLVKHIQVLQETAGSAVSLGGVSVESQGCGFRASRQDVFEFIKQCGASSAGSDADALSHVESALRSHYGVHDSRDLGFGPLRTLAALVQRQRDMLIGGGLSQVYYESALFAKHSSAAGPCESVGLLGELSQTQALASLLSCPLLEDLGQWSQWELVFRPSHGALKDFIERHAANTDLAALEVSPDVLLRITTSTGDKLFSQAAAALDPVGTAGHLVSMVVADGIANAPTALLANHLETSLAEAVAKEDFSQAEEDISCYSTVASFLLDCVVRIPTRTCQALLQQVFLEPFSRVLGQAKSKAVLLSVARPNPRHLNRLHQLGILLGITDWVKDYHSKLVAPQKPNHPCTAPVVQPEQHKADSVISVSSEDEDPEDAKMDYGLSSSHAQQQDTEDEEDVEEDDEELYELTSVTDGEVSSISPRQSETEGSHEEEEEEEVQVELIISDEEDAASSQSESVVNLQKGIINDIRKSEFGIGVELNAEGEKLMKVHQDRLGRSLDRLSAELYSKDTHFVLELIQNADDNSYPSDGTVPSLAFVVERDSITVLNNESGFQEANIRAICDVGRTTKGKHKYGYIGQKGIGFKSVFKVTDCPEVHSNGFHLRFDKNCGPMGYILPHWVEDERPLVDLNLTGIDEQSWTTRICLPLRSENHQTRNLFHDVHPSLLLFLHRLRSITIFNQSKKEAVTMTRRDLSHNVLEVEHPEGTERWLVVKRTLLPKKIKEDVESTEIALAFQLGDGITGSNVTGTQPQKQPVFAFLPLRSFGFRFIIQGDFDIPSSREDVDRDSSWNQWLRSEIPQLFLQAMDVFTDHPEFSGLKGLCHFLQFVPLPDEVLDFFKPVAGQIIQLLKGKAFLPTLGPDGDVIFKLPSQVAVCQDAVILDVIGREELDRHLSLAYLHPGLRPAPPISLLSHLGVRQLRGSDVTTVTTAMAKELVQGEGITSECGLRQLARLLVCNFRALEHGYGGADTVLQTLKELPIIPLADGRLVSLSGEGVFFPMEKSSPSKQKAKAQTGPFSALYKDVCVVHPTLLSCMDPLESQQVRELLRRLGVHELQPQLLLEQHIYPTLRSSHWKSKPEAVVVSYLVFIKQHSSSSQEYSETAIPVLTNRGLLCPAQDRVHFSAQYNNMDLANRLPGYEWVLLSPCYVETDGDVEGWRQLFSRLGVRDRLIIRKERRTFTAAELASSPWAVESSQWASCQADGALVLDDFPSEEFHSLATAQLPAPQLLEQRRALLELLETNWDTGDRYSQYCQAQVIDSEGRPIRSTKSSFFHFLSRLQWAPAYLLQEGGKQEAKYLCPSSVYLFSPEVHSLLGTHVCYLDTRPTEFSRSLGMRHSVSVEELVAYLKKWCVKPQTEEENEAEEEETQGSEFTSTVKHIHSVYTYLQKNCSQDSLRELFHHSPAVFIEYSRRDDDWSSGRFYHLKEVCWSEPTSMFQRYRALTRSPDSSVREPRVLAPFYDRLDGMRDLFYRLNVEPSPTMNQYVGLLELICFSSSMPTAEVLQDVSVLYARLAHKCKIPMSGEQEYATIKTNPSYCSTLKGMVSDKKVFPTKDNNWVTLGNRPMVADSKELEKMFKPYRQFHLLNLPPADRKKAKGDNPYGRGDHRGTVPAFKEEDRSLFLEICGVVRMSQRVKSEAQTENWRPCPALQKQVRLVVPYIQRFLYHHEELADVYQELQDSHIGERIKKVSYGQVGKLYIRYQLTAADDELPVVELQNVICLLKDQKELYIQKDHLSAKLDICRELVKLFCTEPGHRKDLMHFLSGLMTSLSDEGALKRFLLKEDIRELPFDAKPWEVPEPLEPEFPPERVFSKGPPSVSITAEHPVQGDGEKTLMSWPPRASIVNTGASHAGGAKDGAVEAVMKMWPPPAAPKDRDPVRDPANDATRDGSGHHTGQLPSHSGGYEGSQFPKASDKPADLPASCTDHSHSADSARTPSISHTLGSGQQSSGREGRALTKQSPAVDSSSAGDSGGGGLTPAVGPRQKTADTEQVKMDDHDSPAPNNHSVQPVPEAVLVPSVFQGTGGAGEAQRPPLALDSPLWNKSQPPKDALEDLELDCQRPSTVVMSDEPRALDEIGEWGEQLVNSFLCHWRDTGTPGRPLHITWCNQNGETGQPYDFKLTFGGGGGSEHEGGEEDSTTTVIYVEVKSTVKREKAFIHLSANELDFALKEKERYHIYRVYNAGDAQAVRLCRIRNLAQHLHTKDVELFLFV